MTQPTYGQIPNPYVPSGQGRPSSPPPVTPGVQPPFTAPASTPPSQGIISPAGPPPPYAAPPAPAPEKKKKSALLGVIGFFLVILAAVAVFASLYLLIKGAMDYVGLQALQNMWQDFDAPAIADVILGIPGLTTLTLALQISAGAGLVGFIISIIATILGRGRLLGVLGIILGLVAPFVAIAAPFIILLA